MKNKLWLKYLLYLLRWQLSTPLLSLMLILLTSLPILWSTVIANLVGGLIFFWVDRLIFNKDACRNIKLKLKNILTRKNTEFINKNNNQDK